MSIRFQSSLVVFLISIQGACSNRLSSLTGPTSFDVAKCLNKAEGCKVVISLLSERLETCLAVDVDAELEEAFGSGNSSCVDLPGWFDGTNGCKAYGQKNNFCGKFGGQEWPNGHGAARAHCCACGGGHKAPFSVGDFVEVLSRADLGGIWEPGSVQRIYLQEGPNSMPKRHALNKPNQRSGTAPVLLHIEVLVESIYGRGPFVVRVPVPEAANTIRPRSPPSPLRLETCALAAAAKKIFVARPTKSLSEDASDDAASMFELVHEATGLRVGSETGNSTRLALQEASSHFRLWKLQLNVAGIQDGPAASLTSQKAALCLVGGDFGEAHFSAPVWRPCENPMYKDTPYQQWAILEATHADERNCTQHGNCKDDEVDESWASGLDDVERSHVLWLMEEATAGRLSVVARMPPHELLLVERGSAPSEARQRFRKLARALHPDKWRSRKAPGGNTTLEDMFQAVQRAYDVLAGRASGALEKPGPGKQAADKEAERRRRRRQADLWEADELLFAKAWPAVQELDPEQLRCIFHGPESSGGCGGGGENSDDPGGARTNRSHGEGATRPPSGEGDDRMGSGGSSAAGDLWVVYFYSARCSMSRMAAPYLELAAQAHLDATRQNDEAGNKAEDVGSIRFGAFGCGLHGTSRHEAAQQGVRAVFTDPMCVLASVPETPWVVAIRPPPAQGALGAVLTSLGGGFRSSFDRQGSNAAFAERYLVFARSSALASSHLALVKAVTPELLLGSQDDENEEEAAHAAKSDPAAVEPAEEPADKSEEGSQDEEPPEKDELEEGKISEGDQIWLVLFLPPARPPKPTDSRDKKTKKADSKAHAEEVAADAAAELALGVSRAAFKGLLESAAQLGRAGVAVGVAACREDPLSDSPLSDLAAPAGEAAAAAAEGWTWSTQGDSMRHVWALPDSVWSEGWTRSRSSPRPGGAESTLRRKRCETATGSELCTLRPTVLR
mmetsp:Transcript_2985/g.6725  ORF Transcript_2985/g.6725 Transcript_2985/m.6725 type:complete len:958 (+) Transcript_2985:48-2921(+)